MSWAWIKVCYNQNRLAVWMLGITDFQTFEKLVHQHNQVVEKIIATDARWSCYYAYVILGKPFPLGEKAIATNAYYKENYEKYFKVKL